MSTDLKVIAMDGPAASGKSSVAREVARELGWTQPAVSQQVHRLEREAGTQLFIRSTRGVELSDAGQALMR